MRQPDMHAQLDRVTPTRTAEVRGSRGVGPGAPGGGGAQRWRFRTGVGLAICTMLSMVLFAALGTWQVQRLEWKLDLIARAESRLHLPSVPVPSATDEWRSFDFRPLTAVGQFATDRAMSVGVSARDGIVGTDLVVPLVLEDGRLLLVDLGWLADADFQPQTLADILPAGTVEVAGIARYKGAVRPAFFVPEPRPGEGRWFEWDLKRMAETLDAPLLPIVLWRDGAPLSPRGPVPQPVTIDYRNDHLGYAITWYGLAVALGAVYVVYGFQRGKA